MEFTHISECLPAWLSAELSEHTEAGAATKALRSVAPHKGEDPVRMGMKRTEANPGQVLAVGTAKPRTEADWRLITTSLTGMMRDMTAVRNERAPRSSAVISLNIVLIDDHPSTPLKARARYSAMNMTTSA